MFTMLQAKTPTARAAFCKLAWLYFSASPPSSPPDIPPCPATLPPKPSCRQVDTVTPPGFALAVPPLGTPFPGDFIPHTPDLCCLLQGQSHLPSEVFPHPLGRINCSLFPASKALGG